MPKLKMYPWRSEKKTDAATRWRMAQEIASKLQDKPAGSYVVDIEHDTLVFGVIASDGSLHLFEGPIRSSTVDDEGNTIKTPPKILFGGEDTPQVNSFSRKTCRA